MKSISIKSFAIFAAAVLFTVVATLFVNFYHTSKSNISSLVKESIQTKVLTLRHFLERNMHIDNANSITAYLDNAVVTSKFISDIHIVTDDHRVIYATDRDNVEKHPNIRCMSIVNIARADVFSQGCYSFPLRLFKGLKPYYYQVYVYIDTEYLDSLLNKQIRRYLIYFLVFGVLFALIAWFVFRLIVVKPLEKLRQYAYYSTKPPGTFLISEIESIRYSLMMTFKRLKKEQEELYKLSTQDSLSGLYNRLSLMEKGNWLISQSRREKKRFALVFIDLDDFKNINDTRGHEFGDLVLQEVAEILRRSIRQNDIAARFGGDEFVLILTDIEEDITIVNVLERIQKQFDKPIELEGGAYHITASMGVAIYPKDGEDLSTLLKNADIAMYHSKEEGKNAYRFFTNSLNELIEERVRISKLMREGFKKDAFELYYQPKVEIETNRIVGCEALIRLHDEDGKIIPPDKFIPVAESNGFIIPLGKWIIKEAVEQIRRWEQGELGALKVSINISGMQFHDAQLCSVLEENIAKVDPKKLDIELTESVLINQSEERIKLIERIKKCGVSFSMDDFGTGYSSLSYLKKIPFDTIKIDKSFIDDLEQPKEREFVRLIIDIAKNLNLEVVAEGVEMHEQLEILKGMGCDIYQGYLCSKPLPAKEFEALFKSHKCNI